MGQQEFANSISENLWTYAFNVGIIGGITYALAEGFGRAIKASIKRLSGAKWVKLALAVAFGILGGLAADGAGFLVAPAPGIWAKVFAVVMGLGGTGLAMATNTGVKIVSGKFGK